jgi:hypothetical protein
MGTPERLSERVVLVVDDEALLRRYLARSLTGGPDAGLPGLYDDSEE